MTHEEHIQDLTLRVIDGVIRNHALELENKALKAFLAETVNWKTFRDILVWRKKIKAILCDTGVMLDVVNAAKNVIALYREGENNTRRSYPVNVLRHAENRPVFENGTLGMVAIFTPDQLKNFTNAWRENNKEIIAVYDNAITCPYCKEKTFISQQTHKECTSCGYRGN